MGTREFHIYSPNKILAGTTCNLKRKLPPIKQLATVAAKATNMLPHPGQKSFREVFRRIKLQIDWSEKIRTKSANELYPQWKQLIRYTS